MMSLVQDAVQLQKWLRDEAINPDDKTIEAMCSIVETVLGPKEEAGTAVYSPGAERIACERRRQIQVEGWSAEHDDTEHSRGDLAQAAICYAAPCRIYVEREFAAGRSYVDPWPWHGADKRFSYGECRTNPGNVPPDPRTYSNEERVDLLVKAGALIAAEIDRLGRTEADDISDLIRDDEDMIDSIARAEEATDG